MGEEYEGDAMTNRPRLLSPYPGAKNPAVYPVHDGGDYDAWVAPFAGSGEQEAWLARMHPGTAVVAARAKFVVHSSIAGAIQRGGKSAGYRWAYLDELSKVAI